jgi:hypothetical protein
MRCEDVRLACEITALEAQRQTLSVYRERQVRELGELVLVADDAPRTRLWR